MVKREAAHKLYLQDVDLKDIALILKVAYNTVAKWSSSDGWKKNKSEKLLREQTSQDRIWGLIDFQLRVIEKITQARDEDLDGTQNVTQLKDSLIERGDIDALQKLFTTIKSKEVTWDQVVKSTRDLVEHIENADFKLAKKVTPIVNDWLNEKRESL